MFSSFQNNMTPGLWTRVAYPCLKPLASWFRDYLRRVEFFKNWCEKGQPMSFWLPGFYYPQGFMTGALQTHARRYSLPIDQLNFSFHIKNMEGAEDVADAPEDGVYITGLYLEAGRWDRRQKKLKPSNPGEMMSLMPIVHMLPVMDYVINDADYQAPLYKTNLRAGVLNTTGQSETLLFPAKLTESFLFFSWLKKFTFFLKLGTELVIGQRQVDLKFLTSDDGCVQVKAQITSSMCLFQQMNNRVTGVCHLFLSCGRLRFF
jgi:dynein heavy chain